jgi:hypothetical protein
MKTTSFAYRSLRRVGGFSLIEALIVLIVAAFALMLVLSICGQAARTGFALGRRALRLAREPHLHRPAQLRELVGERRPRASTARQSRPGMRPPSPLQRCAGQ